MRMLIVSFIVVCFCMTGFVGTSKVNAQQIPFIDQALSIGGACGGGDSKYDSNGYAMCAVGVQVSAFDRVNVNLIGSKAFGVSTDKTTGGDSVSPWMVSAGLAIGF